MGPKNRKAEQAKLTVPHIEEKVHKKQRQAVEKGRKEAKLALLSSSSSALPVVPTPLTSWHALPIWLQTGLANCSIHSLADFQRDWSKFKGQMPFSDAQRKFVEQLVFSTSKSAAKVCDGGSADGMLALLRSTLQSRLLPQPRDLAEFFSGEQFSSRRHPDGAPPLKNLLVLKDLKSQGHSPQMIADTFVGSRLLASVRESTVASYMSALRVVALFCSILNYCMVPASRQSVWRFAALISNANSLGVYLAVWRSSYLDGLLVAV